MSGERKGQEPFKSEQIYNVRAGVSFKPFEGSSSFFYPEGNEKPYIVPEDYKHALVLRQKVSYLGVEGYIDVISEDPGMGFGVFITNPRAELEKPFGDVIFQWTFNVAEKGFSTPAEEEPYILRFSFIPNSPRDYTRLLHSYVEIKCAEETYALAWILCKPCVKNNMDDLEAGKKIIVVEKNLINMKRANEEDDGDDLPEPENDHIGRIGLVWLPKDLGLLQTIEMVFINDEGEGDDSEPVEPTPPPKEELVPVLV